MAPDSSARRISSWDFCESTAVVGAGLPLAASPRWHIEQCSLNKAAPSVPVFTACAEAPAANTAAAATSPNRIAAAPAILIASPMKPLSESRPDSLDHVISALNQKRNQAAGPLFFAFTDGTWNSYAERPCGTSTSFLPSLRLNPLQPRAFWFAAR